jgi:hypothetical protein
VPAWAPPSERASGASCRGAAARGGVYCGEPPAHSGTIWPTLPLPEQDASTDATINIAAMRIVMVVGIGKSRSASAGPGRLVSPIGLAEAVLHRPAGLATVPGSVLAWPIISFSLIPAIVGPRAVVVAGTADSRDSRDRSTEPQQSPSCRRRRWIGAQIGLPGYQWLAECPRVKNGRAPKFELALADP